MSIIELYQEFGIQYQTEGHKHCRPGWVNIECPFCTGNPGLHLGCNISSGHFYCWRCGWKPADVALAKILGVSRAQAKDLLRTYRIRSGSGRRRPSKSSNAKISLSPFKLPSNTGPLTTRHLRYLEQRGFGAPERLAEEWGLLGTGPVSYLDGIDYRHRIIVPIFWGGKMVSFQARDITGKARLRYIACPKGRERIHHKEILYQSPKVHAAGIDAVICVEGVTDVWRLGVVAVATFGIAFTPRQVRTLARQFRRVIVLFDDDPQAQSQGRQLVAELRFRGVDAWKERIDGDPADLDQEEADYLVRSILGKGGGGR